LVAAVDLYTRDDGLDALGATILANICVSSAGMIGWVYESYTRVCYSYFTYQTYRHQITLETAGQHTLICLKYKFAIRFIRLAGKYTDRPKTLH